MKNLKKYLLFPLTATFLLLAGLYMYSNNKNRGIQTNTEATPSPTPAPIEESIENGVYTNYTYGFRFEYPEDVFDKTIVNTTNSTELESSRDNISYILDVYVYKYREEDKSKPGFGPTLYFAAINKANGEEISQYDYKNSRFVTVGNKIDNITTDNYKGVFYRYEEISEDYRLGAIYYSADWLMNDVIISVKVLAPDIEKLEKFRPQFENMIQTFKFFASNQ